MKNPPCHCREKIQNFLYISVLGPVTMDMKPRTLSVIFVVNFSQFHFLTRGQISTMDNSSFGKGNSIERL